MKQWLPFPTSSAMAFVALFVAAASALAQRFYRIAWLIAYRPCEVDRSVPAGAFVGC